MNETQWLYDLRWVEKVSEVQSTEAQKGKSESLFPHLWRELQVQFLHFNALKFTANLFGPSSALKLYNEQLSRLQSHLNLTFRGGDPHTQFLVNSGLQLLNPQASP